MDVYYIGGSPCSGKSTLAKMLVNKYHFQYYKLDEHLDEYLQRGADGGHELFKKATSMTLDETWFRDPAEQSLEEIKIYEIMFPYAIQAIAEISEEAPVIAEGAGFLPHMISGMNIDRFHYVCIVPTNDFQLKHFSQRGWVDGYLSSCSDKERAFKNWMERDFIFAEDVLNRSKNLGYVSIVNDGTQDIDKIFSIVESAFNL